MIHGAASASSVTACGFGPSFEITINPSPNVWPPRDPWVPYMPWVPPLPLPFPSFPSPWPEEEKRAPVRRKKAKKRRAQVRRNKNRKRAPVRRKGRNIMAKKKKETHIVLVLDKSFSMVSCQQQALDALNEQIDGIRLNAHKGGNTYVSVVLFSNVIDIIHEHVPAAELEHLTMSDYVLDGNTSLRDAMMTAIDLVQPKTNKKKNQGFLVVLISDGQENSSGTLQSTLKSRVDELEGTDRWTFTYMLDGSTWENIGDMVGSGYGSSIGNYATFTADSAGMQYAGNAIRCASVNFLDDRSKGLTSKKNFYTDAKLDLGDGVGTVENKT